MKEKNKKLVLYIVLCVLSLVAVFVCVRTYDNYLDSLNSKSYISDYLSEVKYEDIDNHIVEVPNAIVYVSNSSNKKSTSFEKVFAKVIKKYNLENNITYININGAKIVDQLYQNSPELVFYENGSVKEIVDVSSLNSENKIIKMLKERSVIND